jgi:hypothetical protein
MTELVVPQKGDARAPGGRQWSLVDVRLRMQALPHGNALWLLRCSTGVHGKNVLGPVESGQSSASGASFCPQPMPT